MTLDFVQPGLKRRRLTFVRIKFIYALPIALLAQFSLAANVLEDDWLVLISNDLSIHTGQSCEVRIEHVISQLVGNNGVRVERWTVEACEKLWTYDVEYYPREHFPDRNTDKVVRLVDK